jgi:hypothetical protein
VDEQLFDALMRLLENLADELETNGGESSLISRLRELPKIAIAEVDK